MASIRRLLLSPPIGLLAFRIAEQPWAEGRAIEKAKASGLDSRQLKKFIRDYLTRIKKRPD